MKRITLITALVAALLAPAAASAHVSIAPADARPGDLQRYRLLVPNESTNGRATTGLDVQLPRGVTFALVEAQEPWRFTLRRAGGEITQVSWRGGRIPADGYGAFYLLVRNPVRTGTVTFKTLQRYEGGQVVRWIGTADSDDPSPTVRLSEGAAVQDVVGTHGGAALEPSAPAAPAGAAVDDGGGDGLAIAALVFAALAALLGGLGLWRGRSS